MTTQAQPPKSQEFCARLLCPAQCSEGDVGSAPLPMLALKHQVPLLGSMGRKGFLHLGASTQDALPHFHPPPVGCTSGPPGKQ